MNEAGEMYKPKSCTNNIKVDANDRSEHQPVGAEGKPGPGSEAEAALERAGG